jgi:hypothetical protein
MRWQIAEIVSLSFFESCLSKAISGLVTKVTTRFARTLSGGSGGRPRGIELFLLLISTLRQSSNKPNRRKLDNLAGMLSVPD